MALYFVYRLSSNKNSVKIVGHSTSDEGALKLIKIEADNYVTKKSRKQFDQTEPTSYVQDGVHVTYAIRESRKNVNSVDVYKTEIVTKSGWVSSKVKTTQTKIAQFSVVRYDCEELSNGNGQKDVNLLSSIKTSDYKQQTPQQMDIQSREKAYRQLLPELRNSEVFRNRKKIVEESSNLPPIIVEVEGLNTL